MKKILLLLSLVLCTNVSIASISSINDTTQLDTENFLVIYGNFNKPDVAIDFEVYHSPLDGLVTDDWIPTVVLTNTNSFSVDFQVGFIYLVIIKQPDNSSRALYIRANIPDVVNINIDLDNVWEGLLFYDKKINEYSIHKFEKQEY